ncbi:MAG: VOC family protein [Candidatus Pacebacteria bacterium]|nr:VOC family protein [Candidatus Paceibacterota bacterium]
MKTHHQIQYIEFLAKDLAVVKKFYSDSFGWQWTDFGTRYSAFAGECVEGGFEIGDPVPGTTLPILYSDNLEASLQSVQRAGGTITQGIFSFPGGKRFHFSDPSGNILAVWSDR